MSPAGHAPELTPPVQIPCAPAQRVQDFFDNVNNLDPTKYAPPSPSDIAAVPVMSNTHISYSSIVNANPFQNDRYTRIEDFLDAPPPTPPKMLASKPPKFQMPLNYSDDQPTYRQKGMSHSLSEGNFEFRSAYKGGPSNQPNHTIIVSSHLPYVTDEESQVLPSTPSRGRSTRTRTPSPLKLQDIQEHDSSPDEKLFTPVKRSRSPIKQLFGDRKWLGKSHSMRDLSTASEPKKKHADTELDLRALGSKVKKSLGNFTGDMARVDISKLIPNSASKSKSRSPPKTSCFYVSLTPPFQAKLYSEIELMICATANSYLATQQHAGRMSLESLCKVLTTWANKGRPQVLEFMFDQSTQRDLVLYNLKTFRFYGPNAENIISMNSMMQSWKGLAREMAIRTFCAPDAAILKNLHDAEKVLVMLGAPTVTLMAFREIRLQAEKVIEDGQRGRKLYEKLGYGTENKVDLSGLRTPSEGNPFA